MKVIIGIFLLSTLFTIPAFALDNPGLKQTFTIETDGYAFDVISTSNFEITNHEFEKEEK